MQDHKRTAARSAEMHFVKWRLTLKRAITSGWAARADAPREDVPGAHGGGQLRWGRDEEGSALAAAQVLADGRRLLPEKGRATVRVPEKVRPGAIYI